MTALEAAENAVLEAREAVLVRMPEPEVDVERIAALVRAIRHHDAETVRDLSRQGYSAQEAAKKIDPETSSEVEVRFAGGEAVRIACFSVTTEAATGMLTVEGFVVSSVGQPPHGDAVRVAYLGIPGRGALADITASVQTFSRLDVLHIRISTTIPREVTG